LVGNAAPDFEAEAVFDQEFINVRGHQPKQIRILILTRLNFFLCIFIMWLFE